MAGFPGFVGFCPDGLGALVRGCFCWAWGCTGFIFHTYVPHGICRDLLADDGYLGVAVLALICRVGHPAGSLFRLPLLLASDLCRGRGLALAERPVGLGHEWSVFNHSFSAFALPAWCEAFEVSERTEPLIGCLQPNGSATPVDS